MQTAYYIIFTLAQYTAGTPEEVIHRILFMIEFWTFNLPDQPKIHDAYAMLKKQGVNFPHYDVPHLAKVPAGQGVSSAHISLMLHIIRSVDGRAPAAAPRLTPGIRREEGRGLQLNLHQFYVHYVLHSCLHVF